MLTVLLYLLIGLPLLFQLYKKWRLNYWQRKGVYCVEPEYPYGNYKDVRQGKISEFDFLKKYFYDLKKKGLKYGGLYQEMKPLFIPVEQDFIKQLLLKDFQYFTDHGFFSNPKVDPLSGSLFQLDGEQWRNHRTKLTPTFTSGKMKMMFPTIVEKTKGLEKLLAKESNTGEPVMIKEAVARFTTDIIGAIAFGLDCNCMEVPNNEFRTYCNKALGSTSKWVVFQMKYFPHWLLRAIRFKRGDPETEAFFFNLVESTIKYREENGIVKKDFMQLLIELNNTGSVTNDETLKKNIKKSSDSPVFTLDELTGHALSFFVAGFETSSTLMSFALFELGQRPEIQETLRKEINEVLAKHNGQLTYEALSQMTYLDGVIMEALRKHPPFPVLYRICTKSYQIPDSNITIDKGTHVRFILHAIHNDPELYSEPEAFMPERWNDGSIDKSKYQFLTFGEGPRMCIGMRLGKIQAKCGLLTIIKNYKVTLSNKTMLPLKYVPFVVTGVQGGVWLNMEKIQK
nr:cytochrome P450 [Agasicles hygrophila]